MTTMANAHRKIGTWLLIVCLFICLMVALGGLVRLTYSGLSIVEWKVITGVIPPLSQEHWMAEFEKYQATPQYQKMFPDMTLDDFKFIYWMEYTHRLLGRITGLLFVIPFAIFWMRKQIAGAEVRPFIWIGVLFAFQGVFGWWMVKSGLVDQPQVSHYRLTGHLVLALILLALCFQTGLTYLFRDRPRLYTPVSPAARKLFHALPLLVLVQVALGGMVAGLKAGQVSNTFPKMAGAWMPGVVWSMEPWYANFLENPFMLHFLHRWFGITLLVLISLVVWKFRRQAHSLGVELALRLLWGLAATQVVLGILTVLMQVPVLLASLHQIVALGLFLATLFLAHLSRQPRLHEVSI